MDWCTIWTKKLPNIFSSVLCKHEYQIPEIRCFAPYLDNVLICSKSFKDHVNQIRLTFWSIKEDGVKIKPSKCLLSKRKVSFLDNIISSEGYQLNPPHTLPILNFLEEPSKNIGETRRLLGLVRYFGRHVKNFSKLGESLHEILQKHRKLNPHHTQQEH